MAGCVSCFVLPLLLFIFHRFIQPLILKFWNPWADKSEDKLKCSKEENVKLQTKDKPTYADSKECSELSNGNCCAKG